MAVIRLALLTLLVAAPAAAQDCAEGRVRVEGRCCWPEQAWSEERARCEGPPDCPSDLVEHGDDCVVPSHGVPAGYAPSVATLSPPASAASTAGWLRAEGDRNAPRAWAHLGRGEDEALIAMAFGVFDLGWSLGWIGTILNEATTGGNSWPLSFIPVAGSLVAGFADFGPSRGFSGFGYGFGIASTTVQLFALVVLFPIAFANETTEAVISPMGVSTGPSATLELGAPGSDVGLSWSVRF